MRQKTAASGATCSATACNAIIKIRKEIEKCVEKYELACTCLGIFLKKYMS
jgi:hypothetical protein